MDGRYNIMLSIPNGVRKGVLYLKSNGNTVNGRIWADGIDSVFSGGKVNGNRLEFRGEIKMMLMKISYQFVGVVQNENIIGTVSTKYGNFNLKGNKIS
ncbi:MAG: hypothetical protein GX275_06275 [Clostridiales bacterium]|nr:hypothetical protein [Clostridiales bacterium]